MKYITSILIIFLFIHSSKADCGSSGLEIFPTGQTLAENPIIMIQGGFQNFEYLNKLGKDYSIKLENEKESINLILDEICKTEASYLQMFFKTETKLTSGNKYKLNIKTPKTIEYLPSMSALGKYSISEFEWVVSNKKTAKPFFKKDPKLVERVFTAYGCGAKAFTIFDYKIEDNNDVLFLTELVEIESNFTQLAYIPSIDGKIKVGHNMCYGAFRYSCRNKNYKVRFRIRDINGEFSENWTDWIKFKEPSYSTVRKIFQTITK